MSTHGATRAPLFTIGHSTHEWPFFLDLLRRHEVAAIVDVRSSPYSRFNPQFKREALDRALGAAGIRYVFLGRELGARRDEPECYEGREARYDLIALTSAFREGVERIRTMAPKERIALMCAEKDPITCHRMVLVGHALRADDFDLLHIREDGRLETNADAERRMVAVTGLGAPNLFASPDKIVEEAYRRQGRSIAWVTSSAPPGESSRS